MRFTFVLPADEHERYSEQAAEHLVGQEVKIQLTTGTVVAAELTKDHGLEITIETIKEQS